MISIIQDKMPHMEVFTSGNLNLQNIVRAYKDLAGSFRGMLDFIPILDCIFEGFYSLSEVTIAGLILTEGLDGYFRQNGISFEAKYIRINDSDCIYLTGSDQLLTNEDFHRCCFESKNGIRFKLKNKITGR